MTQPPERRRRILRPGRQAHLNRPSARRTTSSELRRLFNDQRFLQRAASGELTIQVVKDAHPSPPKADVPECTQSQLIAFFDLKGKKLAEAHQYLLVDGTIGASGIPDPKEIYHDGTLYIWDEE